MLLPLLLCPFLFTLVIIGLGWPVARRLRLDPAEKLCASVAISLLGIYLVAFAFYVLKAPRLEVGGMSAKFWILPIAAVIGLVTGRKNFAELCRDADARSLLAGQAMLWTWCVGWLAFVMAYSGGGWAGDWFEHWERARFFLERWPLDSKFIALYPLPARPPLANLVTGVFLDLTRVEFPLFQVVTTLLNGLVFLPAALLARRFFRAESGHGRVVIPVLVVLLMLNPAFVENATFPWTKLTAAFLVLSGLYFFLRAGESSVPRAAGPLCAASLAGALLAHYSAGPFVVLLAVAWLARSRARWGDPSFWRETARLGLLGGAVLATWFGWSVLAYGAQAALAPNTSVHAQPAGMGWLTKTALNLGDTIVPHFLRTLDPHLIEQRSASGWLRDWFFQLYQVNLFFVFGSVAWLAIVVRAWRRWQSSRAGDRAFWSWFIGGAVVIGVAVAPDRDHWGLAHICLQPVVVLGLAFLASQWPALSRAWRMLLIAGAACDLALGIALQFAVQAYAVDRWAHPETPLVAIFKGYSESALMNLVGKLSHHLVFLFDLVAAQGTLVLALLGAILTLALVRVSRSARPFV
ncbi:MAG: hypothetical protein JWM32_132 [Verrucomicrobia bacterium]|nr:hypothetical protein [Verrucomicrobiota bacterium]